MKHCLRSSWPLISSAAAMMLSSFGVTAAVRLLGTRLLIVGVIPNATALLPTREIKFP
jgi:hypothetical protein